MKSTLLTIAMLLCIGTLAAQQMPERAQVRKGNRHYNKGKYEQSIEHYNEALKEAPAQWEATYNLGNALYRAERYEAAEQTMTKSAADSLRSDTERAHAFYNLGNAQFKQKKYKEALQSYKNSLLLNPADEEAKYNYAYTKKLLDDQQQNQENQNQDQDQNQQQNQDQQQQGGNNEQNQPQNQDQNQNQEQNQQPQHEREQPSEPNEPQEGEGQPQQPEQGISEQEQEQILDAIQAQEDRTQEKLKEKQGVVIRGSKNW